MPEPNAGNPALAMHVRGALDYASAVLGAAGIEAPRAEARHLIAHLRRTGRDWDEAGFRGLIARRAAREPMAFLTGERGFWTLDLAVSRATLIPRPDSETLIEAAMAAFPIRSAVRRVLDLGTGTGCLLLAALVEFPAAFGIGVDLSEAAAALAASNAAANGLAARAAFVAGDWGAGVVGPFDLILCNPPYIERGALAGLMPEVRDHEPHTALDGGSEGLDAYTALMPALPGLLGADGAAILELGAGQDGAVRALAAEAGLYAAATRADLGGIARALVLRHAPGKKPIGNEGPAR